MMWQRFTEAARRVFLAAQVEAGDAIVVEPRHLLLALMQDVSSKAFWILETSGVSVADVRVALALEVTPEPEPALPASWLRSTDKQFSDAAKHALQVAYNESRGFNHRNVGTAHLLLGLLAGEADLAARVLRVAGLDAKEARRLAAEVGDDEHAAGGAPQPVEATARLAERRAERPSETSGGWKRFTEAARRVFIAAQEEAGDAVTVEPRHLLLGLLKEAGGQALRIVDTCGVGVIGVCEAIGEAATPEPEQEVATPGRPTNEKQFSDAAKRVLQVAYNEARGFNHRHVGTAHLLLGLLADENELAARVLRDAGLDGKEARRLAAEVGDDEDAAGGEADPR
jgi:ATP-dependent Clp protease ATP-binding subunit ClpA